MIVAEVHDTNGAAILPAGNNGTLPPAYCNPDIWKYIVALLDSANNQLNLAGAVAAPIIWPSGFSAVSGSSGPSTVHGSYASFNRALAGKANLELAYAIAKHANLGATPTTTGTPDPTALARGDSALTSSALYSPTTLAPNPTGGWVPDGFSVLYDYAGTSGDQQNPINSNYTTFIMLKQFMALMDTADLRFKAKFLFLPPTSPFLPVQQPKYNQVAAPFFYTPYQSPGSYIPIVRNEELTLVEAQIQVGLGNYSQALTLINDVKTLVAGESPYTFSADYITTRDTLLKEIDISTANEGSGDRTIAIRNYGMAAVLDNDVTVFYDTTDFHTTVQPIPFVEASARPGGVWSTTCP
jgi:hypothetical protein